MSFSSWKLNSKVLQEVIAKHTQIQAEVELLQSRVRKQSWRKVMIRKLINESNYFKQKITDCVTQIKSTEDLKANLLHLSTKYIENNRNLLMSFNTDFESAALNKLVELYKLQVSINSISYQLYSEKILKLKSKRPKTVMECSNIPEKLKSKNKVCELYKNIEKIVKTNSQYIETIKNNLFHISDILKPSLEKNIDLLNTTEGYLSEKYKQEFMTIKNEIQADYTNIMDYMVSFFDLLRDSSDLEKNINNFSMIPHNEHSLYGLETQELDFGNMSLKKENEYLKSQILNTSSLDKTIILSIVKEELESDRETIRKFKSISGKLEQEVKTIKNTCRNSVGRFQPPKKPVEVNLGVFLNLIDEMLGAINKSVVLRELRVKKLETSVNKSDNIRLNDSKYESFSELSEEISLSIGKSHFDFQNEEISFKNFLEIKEQQNRSIVNSFDINHSKKPSQELSSDRQGFDHHFRSINSDSGYKEVLSKTQTELETSNKHIQELLELDTCNKQIIRNLTQKNKIIGTYKTKIQEFVNEFKSFKELCNKQLEYFESDFQTKMNSLYKQISITQGIGNQDCKEKIEDLVELNESLKIQIEVLKDVFQVEVKKLNLDAQENRKLNKDLKDSLMKLGIKYENQNKFINELAKLIPSGGGDSLSIIKAFVISKL